MFNERTIKGRGRPYLRQSRTAATAVDTISGIGYNSSLCKMNSHATKTKKETHPPIITQYCQLIIGL